MDKLGNFVVFISDHFHRVILMKEEKMMMRKRKKKKKMKMMIPSLLVKAERKLEKFLKMIN